MGFHDHFNFLSYGMLDRSDNLEDTGTIKWDIVLTYLLAWILTYLCILKGIKSAGKVSVFILAMELHTGIIY